jgi:hypothetical protein
METAASGPVALWIGRKLWRFIPGFGLWKNQAN